jgi:uncharacterized protein (TIGR02145 family)
MKKCYFLMLIITFCVSAYAQTQSINVAPGWNLLSLPVIPTDSLKNSIFPTAASSAFIYRDSYQIKDTLQNGLGFWLKFDTAETVNISGEAIYDDTIEVKAGWNMIGSLSMPFYIDSIRTEPEGIIVSEFFNYPSGSSYSKADIISPGSGYWVKVNQDGIIHMNASNSCPSMISYAGKEYHAVQIGNQCWMKENLNVAFERIDHGLPSNNNGIVEKYCLNDMESNCDTYGGLYEWNEAMQYTATPGAQGICPSGWHIPTYAEFQTLSAAVGGDGNALKAIGQGTGTNTSGFSAMLGGIYDYSGGYFISGDAYFLTSTESDVSNISFLLLFAGNSTIYFNTSQKANAFSVRCVKD